MKKLFSIAIKDSKQRALLGIVLVAMCLLTIASQLEIFAVGVITRRGTDAFELFAPEAGSGRAEKITRQDLLARWDEIDLEHRDYITPQDVQRYQIKQPSSGLIDRGLALFNQIFPISSSVKALAIFLICVALFKAVALFMQRYTTRLAAIQISRDLRQAYFEHIQSLPMSFYQQHHIGSLSSRVVGDAALIAEAVEACMVNYVQTPFTVLSTLLLCFWTSWKLSLLVFLGFPLIMFPIIFLARRVKKISKQIQHNQERFASALIDFLAGIQTVKMFAMEEFSFKKYQERNQRMASLEKKSARYDLASRPIVHTLAMMFLATALMSGLYLLNMAVSDLFVYCGFLYLFYEPIKKFAEENSHIQRGLAAAERMHEVMRLQPQIEDEPGAQPLTHFAHSIEFDNVWFRYGSQWILKGVSFTVRKGETVAIVGPTGAGKSTIVQLLPRLYEIDQGNIRIDGQSIRTYTQRSLRELIAFVPQKPFLFFDTVAQNISFGRSFSSQQIETAASKAHAEEFILKLPEGYQTELAEGGKNLSGGQQQRLAIARALIKEAPILVMDEATSSLDAVSEHRIKTAIQQLQGEVTQILIAHRLSTIEHADKIIYIEHGEKIGEGTRHELLKSCPGFKHMWEMSLSMEQRDKAL